MTATTGGWVEVVGPGVKTKLDPATMPHALVSNADGTFTFKRLAWDDRAVGDDKSAPVPSFVDQKINDIFFARNRLGFLTEENVVMSRSGGGFYNFFREKASQVLDTDPIDVAVTDKDVAILRSALPYNEDIVLFSGKSQFRLTSGQDLMTPKTAELKPASKYENALTCAPVSAGSSMFFAVDRGQWSGVMEYELRIDSANAHELSEHVPRYVPSGISRIAVCSPERMVFALSAAKPNTVFAYSYYDTGEERLQSSWSEWEWDAGATILDIGVIASELVLLIQRSDGLHLEKVNLTSGMVDSGADYTTHLDRRITEAQCTVTYDAGNSLTVFTLPYSTPAGLEVWERKLAVETGLPRKLHYVTRSPNQVVLYGDWRGKALFFGIGFESSYEFSEQFVRADNAVRTDGRLQLRRFTAIHGDSAAYRAEVFNETRPVTATADISQMRATAWDALKAMEAGVAAAGIGVVLTAPVGDPSWPGVPSYDFRGPLSGTVTGIAIPTAFRIEMLTNGVVASAVDLAADGSFEFPDFGHGEKTLRVVRKADGEVWWEKHYGLYTSRGFLSLGSGNLLALNTNSNLALGVTIPDDRRAFVTPTGTVAQSCAVVAAVEMADASRASDWVRGLVSTGLPSGLFPGGVRENAWALIALRRYLLAYPASDAATEAAQPAYTALLAALPSLLSGGLYGTSSRDNILMWFALKGAAQTTQANSLKTAIMANLWLPLQGRFAKSTSDLVTVELPGLAPAFLVAAGDTERAALVIQWADYFRAYEKAGSGWSDIAPGVTVQGDTPKANPGVWTVGSAEMVFSLCALGKRTEARNALAGLNPLLTSDGLGDSPEATALLIMATDPQGFFELPAMSPLWTEGPIASDAYRPFMYRFEGNSRTDDGRFTWPVDARSTDAKVRIKSSGALPFSILSAEWEGFYSTRGQRL